MKRRDDVTKDEEYERLKTFIGVFYELFMAREGDPPEVHPLKAMEDIEARFSPGQARAGLKMSVNDCLEQTMDWAPSAIAEANEALATRGAPTIAELRVGYSKRFESLVERGRIRTLVEYYLLKGVRDGGGVELVAADLERIDSMLVEFEERKAAAKAKQR